MRVWIQAVCDSYAIKSHKLSADPNQLMTARDLGGRFRTAEAIAEWSEHDVRLRITHHEIESLESVRFTLGSIGGPVLDCMASIGNGGGSGGVGLLSVVRLTKFELRKCAPYGDCLFEAMLVNLRQRADSASIAKTNADCSRGSFEKFRGFNRGCG